MTSAISWTRTTAASPRTPVIASGTYCDIILPYCRMETRKEPLLVLWGLKKVYELNSKR